MRFCHRLSACQQGTLLFQSRKHLASHLSEGESGGRRICRIFILAWLVFSTFLVGFLFVCLFCYPCLHKANILTSCHWLSLSVFFFFYWRKVDYTVWISKEILFNYLAVVEKKKLYGRSSRWACWTGNCSDFAAVYLITGQSWKWRPTVTVSCVDRPAILTHPCFSCCHRTRLKRLVHQNGVPTIFKPHWQRLSMPSEQHRLTLSFVLPLLLFGCGEGGVFLVVDCFVFYFSTWFSPLELLSRWVKGRENALSGAAFFFSIFFFTRWFIKSMGNKLSADSQS